MNYFVFYYTLKSLFCFFEEMEKNLQKHKILKSKKRSL